MKYSIIPIWETWESDSGNNGYYIRHIGYYASEKEALKAKTDIFHEVREREAIKVGDDIWLLAYAPGFNNTIKIME